LDKLENVVAKQRDGGRNGDECRTQKINEAKNAK
jgi:hypothetical protein